MKDSLEKITVPPIIHPGIEETNKEEILEMLKTKKEEIERLEEKLKEKKEELAKFILNNKLLD